MLPLYHRWERWRFRGVGRTVRHFRRLPAELSSGGWLRKCKIFRRCPSQYGGGRPYDIVLAVGVTFRLFRGDWRLGALCHYACTAALR